MSKIREKLAELWREDLEFFEKYAETNMLLNIR